MAGFKIISVTIPRAASNRLQGRAHGPPRVPPARSPIIKAGQLPQFERGVRMAIQTTANIWHNGKLIPWEKAQVHVMSHVLHYGSSVFEGLRCYKQPGGAGLFRLPEHMQR